MEDNQDFIQQLEDKLKIKRIQLEEIVIGKLKEDLHNYGSLFRTIYTYLVQKGLLKEDLYNYDQKSKMEPPSSEPIPDSEMVAELSFRFSSYLSVLEFLNNMFQIDIDKLNLAGIKQILAIINYIHWDSVNGNPSHPVTRAFSMVLEKITPNASDLMSSEVKFNSIKSMSTFQNSIKRALKDISVYHRELYKFKIRSLITPLLELDAESVNKDRKAVLANIKTGMSSQLSGESFFRELVEELLDEDYGYEIEKKREIILTRLHVKGEEVKKKKSTQKVLVVDKKDLLKIIPNLSKTGDQLSSALAKLEFNKELISTKRKSFAEILKKFFTKKETEIYYEISTTDSQSGLTRKERINYLTFINSVKSKIILFRSLNNSNSPQSDKIKQYEEDMLYGFIDNNLIEIRTLHKRLSGLDNMFKKVEDHELKARIRGIKVETDTIKKIYMDCSMDLKGYSAKKEEQAQLKALGIQS